MSKMGDAVHRRVDAIQAHHERLKSRKFGYLVRPVTLTAGWLVTILGFITIPFPGPGWFTVFVGIGILSLELKWPHTLLHFGLRQYDKFDNWWEKQHWAIKGLLGLALLILIWVVFIALFVLGWNLGMLDWSKSWLLPWIQKLPDNWIEFVKLDV